MIPVSEQYKTFRRRLLTHCQQFVYSSLTQIRYSYVAYKIVLMTKGSAK
jgi:hypothetical protein